MNTLAEPMSYLAAANDDADADIVPSHVAMRRMEQRVMAGVAVLAVAVLTSTIVHGFNVLRVLPDLVTYAFRV